MGGRADKRTGPNLPADIDIDDLDDQDGDDGADEEASGDKPGPGKREAKYRKRARAAEGELRAVRAELHQLHELGAKRDEKRDSGKADELTEVAEELAFVKAAAAAGVSDIEAAWRLCDRKLLRWESEDQDGQDGHDRQHELAGVNEALEKVLDRYPYVSSDHDRRRTDDGDRRNDDRVQPPKAMTTGRPTNGPKNKPGSSLLDRAYLERKYPSLRRRGSHRPPLG
jgi:hypothetical protein